MVWVIFPKFFWQVKELLKLNLYETTIFPNVVACSIDSNLLCDKTQQGRVLKLTKNDYFLVFLVIWDLFPKLLGK